MNQNNPQILKNNSNCILYKLLISYVPSLDITQNETVITDEISEFGIKILTFHFRKHKQRQHQNSK